MVDQPSIAISTINYNSKDNLRNLLKDVLSLRMRQNLSSSKIKNLEIWVVDNDSPDKGGPALKKEFPQIKLIESGENGGFSKGHNLALKKITADYILIINPDVEIPKDAVEQMVDFMKQNPDCGAASCKLINTDNSLQSNGGDLPFGLPLLIWLFNLEMFGLDKVFGNFHRIDSDYYKSPHQVGWVAGTFMFLRSETLKKAGLLPEDYFMYFEDVDYCYRVKQKGLKVMINPKVTVKHFGGASSKDPRFAQFKGEAVGLGIFYRKYFNQITAETIKLLLWISILLRIIAFALVGKPIVAKTYWRVLCLKK